MRTGAALMAESVRSPFDYREPPTLDSDGDGSKPPPPRGSVTLAGETDRAVCFGGNARISVRANG